MAGLSGTMKLALDSIAQAPGSPANELPGGKNTIAALMRRFEAEIDTDERVFLPEHPHVFKTTMHLDGCHSYTTNAVCSCGVGYYSYGERSIKSDPYSAVWMLDDDGETGCARCAAIVAGAPRRFEVVIQRPRGYRPRLKAAS